MEGPVERLDILRDARTLQANVTSAKLKTLREAEWRFAMCTCCLLQAMLLVDQIKSVSSIPMEVLAWNLGFT